MSESPNNPLAIARVPDRVRLYLQVMLVIDLTGYVGDLFLLFSDEPATLPPDVQWLRWGITAVLLGTWSACRFGRPSETWARLLETGVTLGLGWTYVAIGRAYPVGPIPELGAAMSLFGIILLLVLRAALVPSRVRQTLLVGVFAYGGGLVLASGGAAATFDVNLWESLGFMGTAFVVATSVTSRVIYGLRAQVQDALQLGQYTLTARLGAGGMGEVYRARHRRLRRPTAIKLLPAHKSSDRAVERFEREVQSTAALTHPNTIRIYDYGRTAEGTFYYAMEYLDGATLSEVVSLSGPLPPARVLALLLQAVDALEEAHRAGLIHRDIKPENLMLSRQGLDPDTLKVLDFGLVEEIEANPQQGSELIGTPRFLAPELITGASAPTAQSDLYALGAVAYFVLTGSHVFRGGSLVETCSQHVLAQPDPLSSRLGAPVPPDLEALVLRLLSKAPSERPADAAELRDSLLACRDAGGWRREDAEGWWAQHGEALRRRKADSSALGTGDPAVLTVRLGGKSDGWLRSRSRRS